MRHASLFSGIGGPELAASMIGWDNVFHCEINPFGRQILNYWFPNSDSYDDITKTDFKRYRGTIDVLTGGFPCQPFSYAGKRKGHADDRYLWPEMLRAIDEIRPTWVIGENVAGITTMVEPGETTHLESTGPLFEANRGDHLFKVHTFTIERICKDLEQMGYSVQPLLVPACAVGAPHRRDRVFIIAHNADCSHDVRKPREHEVTRGEKRISERNEVRKPGESDNVQSKILGFIEDSVCDGCGSGQKEEQRGKRDIGNLGAGDSERICGEERITSSDTNRRRGSEVGQHLQSELTDGAESIGKGGEWDAALTESQQGERCGADDGTWGEEQEQSGRVGGESIARMLPGERWKEFPTVSPVHRGNDGLPFNVDDLTIPFSKWRNESIKAYGNAIVPQVMYRIFQCIEQLNG